MGADRVPEQPVDRRRGRRRSQPVILDDAAVHWIAGLPAEARPHRIALHFPHIANRFAQVWHSPNLTTAYFDELMLDRRGDRKGFPSDVALELTVLKRHHDEIVRRLLQKVWIDYLITD